MTNPDKVQGIHVGAHKTGTSLLQRYLEKQPETYRGHGVDFVVRDEMSALASWGNALVDHPELLRTRLRAFATDPTRRALFGSYENLLGRPFSPTTPGLYPKAERNLTALRSITAASPEVETKVFCSIRRQSSFVESYYLQAVHEGSAQAFDQWLAGIDLSRLSWRPIVSAMIELFGPEQVEVVDFATLKQGQGRYIGRFMRVLDPDFDDSFDPSKRHNQSVSEQGLRMALAANPFVQGAEERRRLRKFLQRNFSNLDHPRPVLLSTEQAAEIDAHYDGELEELGRLNSFDRGTVRHVPRPTDPNRSASGSVAGTAGLRALVRPADLVLHAGLPACGNAAVDAVLRTARPQLRRQGVAYVGAGDQIRSERRRTAGGRGARQTVLVSDDELLGPALPDADGAWFPAAAAAVAERIAVLRPARTTVVLVVDRPDRAVELAYSSDILAGGADDFDRWRGALADHPFDVAELAERIGALPGVDEVLLQPAGRPTADHPSPAARSLLTWLGLSASKATGTTVSTGRVTGRGLLIAAAMNQHLESDDQRRQVSEFIRTGYPGDPDAPDLFDPQQRAAVSAGYTPPDQPPASGPPSSGVLRLSPSARLRHGTDQVIGQVRRVRRAVARRVRSGRPG